MKRIDRISRALLLGFWFLAALGCSPGPDSPGLRASWPLADASDFPRSEWPRLEFEAALPAGFENQLSLSCDGRSAAVLAHRTSATSLIVNPVGELPPAARCSLRWPGGPAVERTLSFMTAPAGAPVQVRYDPGDRTATSPHPDDFWTIEDASAPTGRRLAIPTPQREPDVRLLFDALASQVNAGDGFSPLAPIVVELSDALDPESLPRDRTATLEPTASAVLLDVDPESAHRGERVPFRLQIRDDKTPAGLRSHLLVIYPSLPLAPDTTYGFILTRRARADASRLLEPSRALAAAMTDPLADEPTEIAKLRRVIEPVLRVAEQLAPIPIPRDEIALALRFSVKSLDAVPRDLTAIREQLREFPSPEYVFESLQPDPPRSPVAAVAHGLWWAPDWRAGVKLARDSKGRPQVAAIREVPFTLALPRAAREGAVPVVFYQHGNPGSAEAEVPSEARRYLAEAGFAVIGFTDVLNREFTSRAADAENAIAAQIFYLLFQLLVQQRLPDVWAATQAEQLAFIQLIQSLGELDLLPVGAPDGIPELDLGAPLTYLGMSEGANHGPALLPYAPEIAGAALVAGGARRVEVVAHQRPGTFLDGLPNFFPDFAPVDLWVALSLLQIAVDDQDPHNHARFLARESVRAERAVHAPSLLLQAGLDDGLVPNHASDSLAWQLGLPLLDRLPRPVPFLDRAELPATADAHGVVRGYVRYAPLGLADVDPTPGCVPPAVSLSIGVEGHFCVQAAREAQVQRAAFLRSVVDGAPRIVDPLAESEGALSLRPPDETQPRTEEGFDE